jgi:hypothetical protein
MSFGEGPAARFTRLDGVTFTERPITQEEQAAIDSFWESIDKLRMQGVLLTSYTLPEGSAK